MKYFLVKELFKINNGYQEEELSFECFELVPNYFFVGGLDQV